MSETLPIVAGILILGVAAQLLARRFQVPSVLFLILIGLGIGGAGLEIVTIETFGETGLQTVVGLSVAVIVFDGAFHLQRARLREAPKATLRLVTLGAVITLVGIALAVRFFLDVSWSLSLLVGALLVATGPTVITPILEVVRVREHVASALEAEGIINDVTAAIAAVVIFEVFVNGEGTTLAGVLTFIERFGTGVVAGLVTAGLIYLILSRDLAPGDAPQAARFLFLSGAVGSFAVAELIAAEAGIAAAATAGIVLGNLELDHRETMAEFGRDLTLLLLAFVFISLAALIDPDAIRELGVGGLLLVITVVLVIRPVVVALSTAGLPRFTRQERLFLGAVGPRGIVVASVATLFAIELAPADPEAAQVLSGAVFLVIFVTVLLQAGLARQIATFLSVIPMRTLIIGGGRVGRALATRLENRGEFVIIIENDEDELERAREAGFTVHAGDGTEPDVLREAGVTDAKRVIAVTENDNDNLLVCQLATSKFDVESVLSRVNKPENVDAFNTLNVTAIDAPTATAVAIDDEIERPALTHWMNEIGEGHDVQEVRVTAEDLVGKTIRELNADIPDGCIVAVIGRDGETHVPNADEAIQYGDQITFIGDKDAVKQAMKRFHPHD